MSLSLNLPKNDEPENFESLEYIESFSPSIMDNVSFQLVVFLCVNELYPPGEDITVEYTLSTSYSPHPKDYIGLYIVGWDSPKHYITYNWAPIPKNYTPGVEYKMSVTFPGSYIKESDDLYQFVFMSHTNDVRGASTSFQIKRKVENETMSQHALISSYLITENLHQGSEASKHLKKQNIELEHKVEALEAEIEVLNRSTESTIHKAVKGLHKQLETAYIERDDHRRQAEVLDEHVVRLEQGMCTQKNQLLAHIQKLDANVLYLKTQLDNTSQANSENENKLTHALAEISELKKSNEQLEKQCSEYREKTSQMECDFQVMNNALLDKDERIMSLNNENELLQKNIVEKSKEIEEFQCRFETVAMESELLKEENANLTVELKEMQEKPTEKELELDEQCKKMEQLLLEKESTLTASLCETKNDLTTKIEAMRQLCDQYKMEKCEVEEQLAAKNSEVEKLNHLSQTQGALFAMKTAQNHLQKKHEHLSEEYDELKHHNEDLNRKITHLQKEIAEGQSLTDDLKMRLQMAKCAYKEKFIEMKALKKELKDACGEHNLTFEDRMRNVRELIEMKKERHGVYASTSNADDDQMSICSFTSDRGDSLTRRKRPETFKAQTSSTYDEKFSTIANEDKTMNSMSNSTYSNLYSNIFLNNTSKQQTLPSYQQMISSESGIPTELKCPLCATKFPPNCNPRTFDDHMAIHYQPSCPFCKAIFSSDTPYEQVDRHVQNHIA